MKSHKVLILGILVAILIIVIAFLVYWFALRSPVVRIQTNPDSASIFIDNVASNKKSINVATGTHVIKITADNYVSYEKQITFKRAEQVTINVLLKPIPSSTALYSFPSSSPIVSDLFSSDNFVYFLGNNGKTIYRVSTNLASGSARLEQLTPDTLSNIQRLIWRPNISTVLLKKPDGIYLYDFNRNDLVHQTSTLWGTNIDEITWSPDGARLAYTYYGAGGEESLVFADIQNKNTSKVANLAKENISHPKLYWSPDNKYIALIANSSQPNTNYLYILDVFTKKITQVSTTGRVIGATWSPDSKYIAYGAPSAADNITKLHIYQPDSGTDKTANLTLNSIDKAVWSSNSGFLVAANDTGTKEQLVNVSLDGTFIPYSYTSSSQSFSNLIFLTGGDRILYRDGNEINSLVLVNPNYE